MKYTPKYFYDNLPAWKRKKDPILSRLFYRPASFLTASIFSNLGIGANTVSYYSAKVIVGYLSGTFDLFHVGHLNLLQRAKEKCDYLIVGVHDSGAWKGKDTFIPSEERKRIVKACRYVDKVVDSCREDDEAWNLYHYDRLFVGSDYKGTERFKRYEEYFRDKGVEIIYFPYTQSTSSTQIRKAVAEITNKEK